MNTDRYIQKIGTLIAENRQRKNLTQAQLADALGTSQSAINRIESGKQNLSLEMLSRISEVLSHNIMLLNKTGKITIW